MNEALIAAAAGLARAQHRVVKRYQQPGEGYRPEVQCRCGWDGWATDFPEHVAQAALDAAEAKAAAIAPHRPSTSDYPKGPS